jgi:hypothetical protein
MIEDKVREDKFLNSIFNFDPSLYPDVGDKLPKTTPQLILSGLAPCEDKTEANKKKYILENALLRKKRRLENTEYESSWMFGKTGGNFRENSLTHSINHTKKSSILPSIKNSQSPGPGKSAFNVTESKENIENSSVFYSFAEKSANNPVIKDTVARNIKNDQLREHLNNVQRNLREPSPTSMIRGSNLSASKGSVNSKMKSKLRRAESKLTGGMSFAKSPKSMLLQQSSIGMLLDRMANTTTLTEIEDNGTYDEVEKVTKVKMSKEFYQNQLKKSQEDLQLYKRRLKNHLTEIHRSLSEKVRSGQAADTCIKQYTEVVKKKAPSLGLASHRSNGQTGQDNVRTAKSPQSVNKSIRENNPKGGQQRSNRSGRVLPKTYGCHLKRIRFDVDYPKSRKSATCVHFLDNSRLKTNLAIPKLMLFGGLNFEIISETNILDLQSLTWKKSVVTTLPRPITLLSQSVASATAQQNTKTWCSSSAAAKSSRRLSFSITITTSESTTWRATSGLSGATRTTMVQGLSLLCLGSSPSAVSSRID